MQKCCCLQWFIINNLLNFFSACFRDPHYPDDYIFEANLLPNVTMPPRTLKGEGVLGPYQPQIGFSQRQGPGRSYSTPEPARRMIRWNELPTSMMSCVYHCVLGNCLLLNKGAIYILKGSVIGYGVDEVFVARVSPESALACKLSLHTGTHYIN